MLCDELNQSRQGERIHHPKDDSALVLIPAGTFMMGSTPEEEMTEYLQSGISAAMKEWFLAATPRHEEHIESFYLDAYPVTNRQFAQFVQETGYVTEAEACGRGWRWHLPNQKWKPASGWNWRQPEGKSGAFPTGPDHPVVQITWRDASCYCQWAGKRLPTEAEWEYACRAGTSTRYYWGDDPDYRELERHAWYIKNSDGATHEVGQKLPNAWGLYDMCGNVWEWVADSYESYPGASVEFKQQGDTHHVQRGGAWYFHPTYLRSVYRGTTIKGCFAGFRCAMDRDEKVPSEENDTRDDHDHIND